MENNLIEKVNLLISKNELKTAMLLIVKTIENQEIKNEIAILSGRLEELKRNARLGIVSESEKILELNQIRHSLMESIKLPKQQKTDKNETKYLKNNRLIIFGGLITILIISYLLFQLKISNDNLKVDSIRENSEENSITLRTSITENHIFKKDEDKVIVDFNTEDLIVREKKELNDTLQKRKNVSNIGKKIKKLTEEDKKNKNITEQKNDSLKTLVPAINSNKNDSIVNIEAEDSVVLINEIEIEYLHQKFTEISNIIGLSEQNKIKYLKQILIDNNSKLTKQEEIKYLHQILNKGNNSTEFNKRKLKNLLRIDNEFERKNILYTLYLMCIENNNSVELTKGDKIRYLNQILRPIYFDFNESSLSDDAIIQLDEYFDLLLKNNLNQIFIEAHSNENDAQSNMLLCKKRAKTVKNYLVEKGFTAAKLKVVFYGAEKNIKKGNSSYNRRVKLNVVD